MIFPIHDETKELREGFKRAILSTIRNDMLDSFIRGYQGLGKMDKEVVHIMKGLKKPTRSSGVPKMNKQDILLLYKYNQWANALILNAAANVTQDEYLAPASFPYGGLRGTLVHTLFAEWVWHQRWEGTSPTKRFKPEDFPTFDSLRTRWAEEEQALMSFVENLTDEKLERKFRYNSTDGQPHERILWQVMAHMVNHGTQHRAEAAAILTNLGHSPGDIDLLGFID